jgi:very-short-patch-repair endonuclease
MPYLPYQSRLKIFSGELRNHSTLGEVILWKKLHNREMYGYPFHRQKPLENYIVDFYCSPLKLIIEIDGQYHNIDHIVIKDEKRTSVLQKMGLNILRFTEQQIRHDLVNVLREIESYILNYEEKYPEVKLNNKRKKKKN